MPMTKTSVDFAVEIRPSERPGVVKGYADVRVILSDGEIELIGFAIIKQPGKDVFIGFPQIRGRNKYFPVVEAKGKIRDAIVKAILDAQEKFLL